MSGELAARMREEVVRTAAERQPWTALSNAVSQILGRAIPFDACCWHTVDPGTILFTGSVNQRVGCSGSWLARHEYILDDVNKWSFLARSGRGVGASSIDTHGDLSRSARHRSREAWDFGDELRISFVVDGVYWGAAAFLRYADQPWFSQAEVELLGSLSVPIGVGLRRAITAQAATEPGLLDHGPGVVVFDELGQPESISPAAERWIDELVEEPPPHSPGESKIVRVIAARARAIDPGSDPLELSARARVRTRDGRWLLLYGTRLGGDGERTAVIIHPATPHDVAPVIALSYGLTEREAAVAMQCVQGRATKEIAAALCLSPYTVQDHFKSIFDKTGVRTRGELVGQIFLDHYATRWDSPPDVAPGLIVKSIDTSGD